jgi:hypothetical protein
METRDLYDSAGLRKFLRQCDDKLLKDLIVACGKVCAEDRESEVYSLALTIQVITKEVLRGKRTMKVLAGGKENA